MISADVSARTVDGVMAPAERSGTIYAVKNVGKKVSIEVDDPAYGHATIETALPMIDPIYVNVTFTAPNRAILSQVAAPDLGAIPDRAPGPWTQPAASAGGGSICESCTPIGDGTFSGDSCDGGAEADDTSCAFNDTVTEWYCYTASCTGDATASTCDSAYDTALSVWDACGGTELACNDDSCGMQSTVTWAATGGTTYYIRLSGFNGDCGSYTLDVSCDAGGGCGCGCGDCNVPNPSGLPGCSDQTCQDIVCGLDPFCCSVAWDSICAGEATSFCDCGGGGGGGCGDCNLPDPNGLPGCSDPTCVEIVCTIDAFCCCVAWDINCANEAASFCDCGGGGCDLRPLACPAGALEEGEACGSDTNGGCDSTPAVFTDAACGDTFCGTAWAIAGSRDTDWYLVDHDGGILSATLTSNFAGVCFIVDGVGSCAPVVAGDIGCSDAGTPIADASADLPAGQYVVFVAAGDCAGGGIFEHLPCGTDCNAYNVSISCVTPATGACCLPDNTCVDGVTREECEAPAPPGDCGNCQSPSPSGSPGCSDAPCQGIVCAVDPFCCSVAWDNICADEAGDLCDCGGGGGGGGGGLGGVYLGDDTVCPGPTCIPVGGCCRCDDTVQFCTIESEADCDAVGGEYLGDGAACESAGGQDAYSSNPNALIPDADPNGVSDTIVVPFSFNVLDLQVAMNISHTWVGDLCVTLSKDGGPETVLIQRMGDPGLGCNGGCCGCDANNINVTLDDAAGISIEHPCVNDLAGTYRPFESLAGYVGGDSSGSWTIRVSDNFGGDLGILYSWSLIITQPAGGDTPCQAAYPDQCADCFTITNESVECQPDGTTFTYTVDGIDSCTGEENSYVFTASGGAPGQEICFTIFVVSGAGSGCPCSAQVCTTIPDCVAVDQPPSRRASAAQP